MAKIKASLADIKTEFQQILPDVYEFEIRELKDTNTNEGGVYREQTHMSFEVVSPGEFQGRKIEDTFHLHKKDGEYNEVSLGQIKSLMLAVDPAEVEKDEPDTSVLLNGRFKAEVYLEPYTYPAMKQGQPHPKAGQTTQFARIRYNTAVAA
jgi:hypothetical protein